MEKKFFELLGVLSLVLFLSACNFYPAGSAAITDSKTTIKIEELDHTAETLVLNHTLDNMDRGNREFTNKQIIVDPNFYKSNEISRGDILYFRQPNGKNNISRVIGLEGDKVKIVQGVVYLNGKRLDTFYGEAHRLGNNTEQLERLLSKDLNHQEQKNVKNIIKKFEKEEFKEIQIPENHVFLIGDDWFRSVDSRHFGYIKETEVLGKVLGYLKIK
jgi:signal peptidase I